jgi:hypothetical protein
MGGKLAEKLIPRLLTRFADRGVRIHAGRHPVATFSASHPEVGELQIDDDDEELTISVGRLTHGHFSPSSYLIPREDREEEVLRRVAAFLDAVFGDRVEFWTAGKMGGWYVRGENAPMQGPHVRIYAWSGPIVRR